MKILEKEMELIEIIISSVKIFSIVATVVILVSYIVFKVKNKNRTKVQASPLATLQPEVLLNDQVAEIPEEEETGESYEEMPQYEEQPEIMIPYRTIKQRFQVINEDKQVNNEDNVEINSFYKPKSPVLSEANSISIQGSVISYKPGRYSQNAYRASDYKHSAPKSKEVKGIYNLYSLAVSEPMHKLKV
jgi:hypothetical protein